MECPMGVPLHIKGLGYEAGGRTGRPMIFWYGNQIVILRPQASFVPGMSLCSLLFSAVAGAVCIETPGVAKWSPLGGSRLSLCAYKPELKFRVIKQKR